MRKTLLIISVLWLVPNTGFGFPAVNSLIEEGAKRLPRREARNLDTCTNFSGSWKGSCTAQGQTVENAERDGVGHSES